MIINPRKNQLVKIWYRKSNSHLPYHNQDGIVTMASQGKPRNHLVSIGGVNVVVPCGNLKPVKKVKS